MCTIYRQAGYGPRRGDMVLIPTTRDEVAQYGNASIKLATTVVEVCADGKILWDVKWPLVLRHPYEEDVMVPPGLYEWRPTNNIRAGAPAGEGPSDG